MPDVRPAGPALFLGSIIAANYITARHGLIPAGFGLHVTAGTYLAGVALTARDLTQDAYGIRWTVPLIAAGGALSWATSTPQLALASTVAVLLSELADLAVYTPLRRRSWQTAVWASLIVGAIIDSAVFLSLAGFGLTTTLVVGQLLGKAYATIPFSAARAGWTFTARRRQATA